MSDVFEHNPGDHEDPLTGPSWYVGLVGGLILVATLLGLTALYYNMVTEEEVEKVINTGRDEFDDLRREQSIHLTGSDAVLVLQRSGERYQLGLKRLALTSQLG